MWRLAAEKKVLMQPAPPRARICGMLIAKHGYRGSDRLSPSGLLHAGAAALAIAVLVVWLQLLGRPFLCPCGTVRLWAPSHDSQHVSDWYSLLHLSFGLGLFVVVAAFQPRWSSSAQALVAVLGSAVWEAVENIPAVIALFNPPAGGLVYRGDTILNALGDIAFVILGCSIAARLPLRVILMSAVLIELSVWLAIRDGIVIGAARLMVGTEA